MEKAQALERFVEAHKSDFQKALSEVRMGRKQSHWMWYIFPQLKGLGQTEISKYYAIQNIKEAKAFLTHPFLGDHLILISNELLKLESNDAVEIFGNPDDLKLKSCMTLFSVLSSTNPVFKLVLDKFFKGSYDAKTLKLLDQAGN
jgi:uncharacterized protein (DUF1810 family)